MATANSILSESSVRALIFEIRSAWLVLSDVDLVLEMRDTLIQDRNPTMRHTLGLVTESIGEALTELEARLEASGE